jgi:hypothetical protein
MVRVANQPRMLMIFPIITAAIIGKVKRDVQRIEYPREAPAAE